MKSMMNVSGNTAISTSEPLNIGDVIDRYIANLDVKPRSKDGYRKGVRRFFDWTTRQGVDVSDIRRTHILVYKAELEAKYSAHTVSAYVAAVKSFFAFLEAELGFPNITKGVKGGKHQHGFRKSVLAPEDVISVLGTIDRTTIEGKRNYALMNLLVRTALRTIEVERAKVGDIRNVAGRKIDELLANCN